MGLTRARSGATSDRLGIAAYRYGQKDLAPEGCGASAERTVEARVSVRRVNRSRPTDFAAGTDLTHPTPILVRAKGRHGDFTIGRQLGHRKHLDSKSSRDGGIRRSFHNAVLPGVGDSSAVAWFRAERVAGPHGFRQPVRTRVR